MRHFTSKNVLSTFEAFSSRPSSIADSTRSEEFPPPDGGGELFTAGPARKTFEAPANRARVESNTNYTQKLWVPRRI